MSSPLAIAVVSAVIMDLLHNGLIDHDLSAVGSFKVSAKPPDRVFSGAEEGNQLNLFLYQVTANAAWRNTGLPSHDGRGGRLTNPPLALDLHYLLTAYGKDDLNAEILLGYAMELLHDLRVISRDAIRLALSSNSPIVTNLIPPDNQGRSAVDLADQIELIKITPQYLPADDLAKLWAAMQSRYRPSMGYQASVVLIQGMKPAKSALPVLARGEKDSGPVAHGNLRAPFATVTERHRRRCAAARSHRGAARRRHPAEGLQPGRHCADRVVPASVARDRARATGHAGGRRRVGHRAAAGGERGRRRRLARRHLRRGAAADQRQPRHHDQRSADRDRADDRLAAAARGRAQANGDAEISVKTAPAVHPGQRASVIVGGDEYAMPPVKTATDTVAITIAAAAPTGEALPLRVRIDGLETLVIPDRAATPPQFDPKQSITIT